MVAAVPLTTNTKNDRFDLTTTDLRNVAFGLFAALALIMVAGSNFPIAVALALAISN